MDLLDGLGSPRLKKKTTYKKEIVKFTAEHVIGDATESTDRPLATSILSKVQKRLARANAKNVNLATDIYDGEELEARSETPIEQTSTVQVTQKLANKKDDSIQTVCEVNSELAKIPLPIKLGAGGIFESNISSDRRSLSVQEGCSTDTNKTNDAKAQDTQAFDDTVAQPSLFTGFRDNNPFQEKVDVEYTQTQVITNLTQDVQNSIHDGTLEIEASGSYNTYDDIQTQGVDSQTKSPPIQSEGDCFLPTVPDNVEIPKKNDKLLIHSIQEDLYAKEKEVTKITEHKEEATTVFQGKQFSKEDFLKNFDELSQHEESSEEESSCSAKRSPSLDSINDDDTFDDFNGITNEATKTGGHSSLIKGVAGIHESVERQIDLDSGSDEEYDAYKTASLNMSKAALLQIKLKNYKAAKSPATSKVVTQQSPSLKELILSLKQANRKQLLNHRKELTEKRGITLEELENEREQVENLLELEIERNRRIRLREKQQEKRNTEDNIAYDSNSSDDLDSEVPESDCDDEPEGYSSQIVTKKTDSIHDEDDYDAFTVEDYGENEQENVAIGEEEEEEEEEIVVKNRLRLHAPRISDEEKVQENEKLPIHAIDLGAYGSNLKPTAVSTDRSQGYLSSRIKKVDNLSPKKTTESLAMSNTPDILSSPEHVQESEAEDPPPRELIEALIKKRQLLDEKARKRRKDLKRKGVNKMVEIEADESEDEWHGVGGVDQDFSDENDSELERMIDDYSTANFSRDDIREILAKEDKDKDERMVNKILQDIKTGGFRKRGKTALDLILSDDEDQELQKYRAKRLEKMRQKTLENADATDLKTYPKSHPFFQSMVDDVSFKDVVDTSDNDADLSLKARDKPKEKTKVVISEQFVRETLSFLSSTDNGSDNLENKRTKSNSLGLEEEMEETEDIFSLKQRSTIKLINAKTRQSNIPVNSDDENDDFHLGPPSIVKAFHRKKDTNDKFKDGIKSVKIASTNKVIGASRAAITFLGRKRKLVPPKNSARKPSNQLLQNQDELKRRKLFEQNNSFEA
ncbi:HCL682Cp [Eremothecium sinecaudum]|uniref:HCL682Cp n=1 Tax=Eremothecium sinecaudum TaxID=45286 RepID=A0A120K1K0_9SACH|nr:HCL682Cp [Eremothecium sinecaudum]AMD19469.1 HCL682Cp [Eremothecium sinecaudum]